MKKAIAFLLVAICLVPMATGCSKKDDIADAPLTKAPPGPPPPIPSDVKQLSPSGAGPGAGSASPTAKDKL